MLAAVGGLCMKPIDVTEAGVPRKGEPEVWAKALTCAEAIEVAISRSADCTSVRTGTLYLYSLDASLRGKVSVLFLKARKREQVIRGVREQDSHRDSEYDSAMTRFQQVGEHSGGEHHPDGKRD